MRIGFNISSISQNRLQATTRAIGRALERLSTGSRVNEPRDDVASYSMGIQLDSQVRGLRAGLQNINSAQAEIQTADLTISQQLEMVERMREIALAGASSSLSSTERQNLQTELQQLLSDYRRISSAGKTLSINPDGEAGSTLKMSLGSTRASDLFTKNVGTGSFEARQSMSTFGSTTHRFGDFNNDGHLDILAGGTVQGVFLGHGDGSFSLPITQSVLTPGADPADFNGDGNLDYVGADGGGDLIVNLGRGDGTFEALTSDISIPMTSLGVSDLEGDGDLDIVSIDTSTFTSVLVLENDGSGVFSLRTSYEVPSALNQIQSADFNGDNKADLLAIDSTGVITIYGGAGDGTFSTVLYSGNAFGISGIRIGDLERDGDLDIVGYYSGTTITPVYRNNGAGSFTRTQLSSASGGAHAGIELGDLNGDGVLDIVTTATTDDWLNIFLSTGVSSYAAVSTLAISAAATGNPRLGDVNEDGVMDVVVYDGGGSSYSIYRGKGVERSAESDISVSTADRSANLIGILDETLERLRESRGDAVALHSRLDSMAASNLLISESLSEAKDRLIQSDMILETAELARLQILQQAQVAIAAQANVGLSMVLKLLSL